MFDYFSNEVRRFGSWAIACFVLHLAALAFASRVIDLAQQPEATYQEFASVYVLLGVLLGAWQMSGYRKPNAWLNLLHRPVAHWRIAGGLMLAGAALLLAGVLAPLLLTAAWQGAMTARVLDARHVELACSGWLLSACGYLAGAFALLATPRRAAAAVPLLLVPLYCAAAGAGALLLQVVVLAWLAGMVLASFKPNLATPPHGVAGTILVAAPLQVAMWLALVLSGVSFEVAWMMQGTHPDNLAVPVAGSVKTADSAEPRDLVIAGLQGSHAPDAALWREQAAISDVHMLRPGLGDLPVRGQLTNPAPLQFDDSVRRVRWSFSHDRMRFEGASLATGRPAGTLGVAAGRPFPQPPLPVGDSMLATPAALYQYDDEANRIVPRVQLQRGERMIGFGEAADRFAVLTRDSLLLYDLRDLHDSDAPLVSKLRVPLPGRAGNLSRVDMMELIDGALVSFTFTRGAYDGLGGAHQDIVRVDEHGGVATVAHRPLSSGYSPLYGFRSWYLSPVLHALRDRVGLPFSGYVLDQDAVAPRRPRSMGIIAAALCVLALLLAAWRSRRLALPTAARVAWIVACAVVGVPALMAFWLMYRPRERLSELIGAAQAVHP